MNYIPLTAAQKQILRDRTLLLARIMERYLEGSNTIEAISHAFNLLIDVEPDLDVALTYANDRIRFASLITAQRLTLIEDYRNLAYSPPDKKDDGAPNVDPRQRYAVQRMPLNSDPNDKREVNLYEPLTPEDRIVSVAVDKRRDLYSTPKPIGRVPFDSSQWHGGPPSDRMRPVPAGEDDLFREGYVVKPIPKVPLPARDTDLDMIRHAVCPSTFAKPATEHAPGPAKPPHLIPPRETDPMKMDPRQVRDDNWTFPKPTDLRRG